MNPAPRFLDYAAAFEKTYLDDDWHRLEEFFTEDAVYSVTGGEPLGGRWEGRADLIAQLHNIVDRLDRRFDRRAVEIVGVPNIEGNTLSFEWRGSYSHGSCEDLVIGGVETARFERDRIAFLEDAMHEGADSRIQAWFKENWGETIA